MPKKGKPKLGCSIRDCHGSTPEQLADLVVPITKLLVKCDDCTSVSALTYAVPLLLCRSCRWRHDLMDYILDMVVESATRRPMGIELSFIPFDPAKHKDLKPWQKPLSARR